MKDLCDSVGRRRAEAADQPFLRALHTDRLADELLLESWPEAERAALVDLQFRAQQEGYAIAFPGAEHWIVVADGEPAGRVVVDPRPDGHTVVDLVIGARHRGRGIGTRVMEDVLAEAARAGVPVRLTASAGDVRLVRWYERLGFRIVDRDDLVVAMVAAG